jgi:hypothetical protein
MPFGRGFATAAVLILIALACIATVRRLERERRLITKLTRQDAFDMARAIRLDQLTDDEQDTVRGLTAAGVLRGRGNARYIERTGLASFRRKRIGLAISGAVAALIVAGLAAFVILQR